MSALSAIRLGIYAFTALLCIMAARSAGKNGLTPHIRSWNIIAAGVALLLLSRAFYLEEFASNWLRDFLRESGRYEHRRDWQTPLVIGIVLVGLLLAPVAWFGLRDRRRRNAAQKWVDLATLGLGGYIVLACLRTVSLHALDRLLHGGLHLNRALDLGLIGIIALSAWQYRRTAQPAPRRLHQG